MVKVLSKKEQLAENILDLSRESITARLPYLNRAVMVLPVEFREEEEEDEERSMGRSSGGFCEHPDGIGTDGKKIVADADGVLRRYAQEENLPTRILLHMTLHLLFSHPFAYGNLDRRAWDFAVDLAAENMILSLNAPEFTVEGDKDRLELLEEIRMAAGNLEPQDVTAERIYTILIQTLSPLKEFRAYATLFAQDEHAVWASDEDTAWEEVFSDRGGQSTREERRKAWQEIRDKTKLSMETRGTQGSGKNGDLIERLAKPKKDHLDYSTFLNRFARRCEEVRINQEEFDLVYYTYGLSVYGNVPLIESLEYRETKKISEFVIAIDTSGSCSGDLVRQFVAKTYAILTQEGSFTETMNLHLIQCDSSVRKDSRIRSSEDLERWMAEPEVIGGGGTDFRPVFGYVDELVRHREFDHLQGLIYFTDGLGTYPSSAPDYSSAFVFLDDGKELPPVPAWADTALIRREDLKLD